MTQENQTAEQPQELTPEQVNEQISRYRDGIINAAVENKLSFDVVFNALSQVASNFVFDFLLLTEGQLSDENVAATVERFNQQTIAVSKSMLDTMREHVKRQQEAAEKAAEAVEGEQAEASAAE